MGRRKNKRGSKVAGRGRAGRSARRAKRGGERRGRPATIADREVIAISLPGVVKKAVRELAKTGNISISEWIRTSVTAHLRTLGIEIPEFKAPEAPEVPAAVEATAAPTPGEPAVAKPPKVRRKGKQAKAASGARVGGEHGGAAVLVPSFGGGRQIYTVDGPVLLGNMPINLVRFGPSTDVLIGDRVVGKAALTAFTRTGESVPGGLLAHFLSDFGGAVPPPDGIWIVPFEATQSFDVEAAQLVTVIKSIQLVTGPEYVASASALRARVLPPAQVQPTPSGTPLITVQAASAPVAPEGAAPSASPVVIVPSASPEGASNGEVAQHVA